MASQHRTKYCFLAPVFLLVIIAPFGCDYFGFTKIKEIMDSPLKFEGKEVKLKGVVMEAVRVPFTETVVYTLKDDSGSITVIAVGTKPNNGDKVRVKGRVSTAIKIGPEAFGTHVIEVKRW
jgi:cytochrome c-type biogenesis protein CcmE